MTRSIPICALLFSPVLDIGVCYLGFTWEELGLSKPSDVEIDCTALLDDMLDGGIFGQNDMNRVHSANITLNICFHTRRSSDLPIHS